MTAFDVAALLIVLVSALIGWSRGAVKELVTLTAFALAALAAVFLLPITGGLFRRLVHPAWAGNAAAIVVLFLIVYIALRVMGAWITQQLHASSLGSLDRGAGGVIGVLRALVVLGAFFLVFAAVTPAELRPPWITGALTWPLAGASGRALSVFAPAGMKLGGAAAKVMGEGVSKSFSNTTDEDQGVELGAKPEPEPTPPAGERLTDDTPSAKPTRRLTVRQGETHAKTAKPATERSR